MLAVADRSVLTERAAWLVLAASIAIPGAAILSQFGFGLRPCELCIWQRWPYLFAVIFSLIAALGPKRFQPLLLVLAALALVTTAGVGVFHVGVEQHWWAGLASCSGDSGATTLEEMRKQIMGAPIVRCDDIAFQFLGISMAGWNVITASVMAIFALVSARRLARG
jgi:disulfide bond formation protein DsbB